MANVKIGKKDAQIEVRPVAWTGQTVNKWEARCTVQVENRQKPIVIIGDPMPNEKSAVDALRTEIIYWQQAVAVSRDTLANYKPDNDKEA